MAVVLSAEDNGPFSSSPGLRRSHSQSKFNSKQSMNFHASASNSRLNDIYHDAYHEPFHFVPESSPCSTPPSPPTVHADSVDQSYSSTPVTNLSFDSQCEDGVHSESGDHVVVSGIHDRSYFGPLEDLEPPLSSSTSNSYTVSPSEDVSVATSHPESPELIEHAEDDTAVRQQPTQHVDYLSHNWREEDIWASWRYIVSKRGEYSNGPRLENASWRTWMKAKYNLGTVSPETLNWLKDCDVTWLYGPLQTHNSRLSRNSTGRNSSGLSKHGSFAHKKPILKKRSMSEVMLQRSLSSSSLLRQATAAIQAQQKDRKMRGGRPSLHRASTVDYVAFPFFPRRRSYENTVDVSSASTSCVESPGSERKHIHFDEQVKQCIAVDVKGDDDDDEDEVDHARWMYGDDSDSDDGVMMKPTRSTKKPILRKKPQPNLNAESKTIAMLPSTTLKYRVDSPEPTESAMKHSSSFRRSPALSPSPSQETLRPSRPSGSLYYDEDDEDVLVMEMDNSTPVSNPIDSPRFRQTSSQMSASQSNPAAQPEGLRRTESGMLMPVDVAEAQPYQGLVGRVVDTVNTARDIVHVIWNVGWR
ncbi:hypothetical protein DL765_011013 [Monosporascus sp. GIB2]|nr:hypothetical protein DL765_011013 [Monosporascus sp. GIB2]